MMAASHDGKIYWLQIGDGKRLDVTNAMLRDNTIEARMLKTEWARAVADNNGDFLKPYLNMREKTIGRLVKYNGRMLSRYN